MELTGELCTQQRDLLEQYAAYACVLFCFMLCLPRHGRSGISHPSPGRPQARHRRCTQLPREAARLRPLRGLPAPAPSSSSLSFLLELCC